MTDEKSPPPWENRPFDWIRLSDEQAHRVSCAFSRRLDLRSLASDALFYSLVLEGRSPHIDETTRGGGPPLRRPHEIAPRRCRRRARKTQPQARRTHPSRPTGPATRQFARDVEAGARADIQRLKLPNPPHWVLEWAITSGSDAAYGVRLLRGAPTAQPGASTKPSG